jgi:putative transposase
MRIAGTTKTAAATDYERPGYLWAYDFVFDTCANGQQLKCLTVIDEYTRECLAIHVAGSLRSRHVIDVLSRLVSLHGAPKYLRSDNGPEFVSTAILKWLADANIGTAYIDPGKPWLNGMNESFNGKLRDECLNMQWFKNRIDAKILIEQFRRQFNETRPHSSLGNLTPAEFNGSQTPEFDVPDLSADHYLRIYRLRLGMAEDGTTHPSADAVESMRRLVAALSAMEPNAPVRLEAVDSSARFIEPLTGQVLAEIRLAADV